MSWEHLNIAWVTNIQTIQRAEYIEPKSQISSRATLLASLTMQTSLRACLLTFVLWLQQFYHVGKIVDWYNLYQMFKKKLFSKTQNVINCEKEKGITVFILQDFTSLPKNRSMFTKEKIGYCQFHSSPGI